jgi:antitoxin CptB
MNLDVASLNKLKWRCRRGLLENDLFFERFFRRHETRLTERNVDGLRLLIDLPDNDLLDLLLARGDARGPLDCVAVHEVLALIRTDPMTERHCS